MPGTPLSVSTLRREITAVAADCGMDAEGIADVRLAVSEAATNAVIHAYSEAPGELEVTAFTQDRKLEIVVGDTGPGLVERRDRPGPGRRALRDRNASPSEMRIVSNPGGTEIHMRLPWPAAGPGASSLARIGPGRPAASPRR